MILLGKVRKDGLLFRLLHYNATRILIKDEEPGSGLPRFGKKGWIDKTYSHIAALNTACNFRFRAHGREKCLLGLQVVGRRQNPCG